ncbi:MAG: hypothetical protein AAF601_14060 [Pseudomonadota bacterium]
MADLTAQIETIIAQLDDDKYGVAIAHMRDAVEAMNAAHTGGATKYALHERLAQGQVMPSSVRRKIR